MDVFVAGVGTGGTITGVGAVLKERKLRAVVTAGCYGVLRTQSESVRAFARLPYLFVNQ